MHSFPGSFARERLAVDIAAPGARIRWKSISGVGLAFLLVYGALNVVSAIVVPIALEARAGQGLGDGAVIIGRGPEEYMIGTTYAQLHREKPKLDKLLVDSMLAMCAQMMAMAVAFLGIAWFAGRRGARWAPWVLLVSGVVWCRTTSSSRPTSHDSARRAHSWARSWLRSSRFQRSWAPS